MLFTRAKAKRKNSAYFDLVIDGNTGIYDGSKQVLPSCFNSLALSRIYEFIVDLSQFKLELLCFLAIIQLACSATQLVGINLLLITLFVD